MEDSLTIKAKEIIGKNLYTTVSTVGIDSIPWVSPLFYAIDESYQFYWVSPKTSRHSINISQNSNVSWVCFDSTAAKWTGVGVYFSGICNEVTDEIECAKALKLLFAKLEEPIPDILEYLGESIYHVYRAKRSAVWITNDITENGKTIDARSEIILAS